MRAYGCGHQSSRSGDMASYLIGNEILDGHAVLTFQPETKQCPDSSIGPMLLRVAVPFGKDDEKTG